MTERLALIVAIDRYENPALQRLGSPTADAEALAGVLGDPDRGEFAVDVLTNPTWWEVAHRVEDLLADRRPDDTVLLHFSCHGLKDAGGRLYLAATNTRPDRLASTAVAATWINHVMQDSRARRIVLLLDCCYGGAFERGVLPRGGGQVDVGDQFRQDHLGEGRGRAVITASTAMEYAFEGVAVAGEGPAQPSVFTGVLVEGLRSGDADRDRDGRVGLGELYDYVYDRVRQRSPRQTPCKWEFGVHGGLYLARSPHRHHGPGLLPPDLAEAVASPNAFGRLGAVAELAGLAAGTDPARAAMARRALERLADDDSRRVSTAAAAALAAPAVAAPAVAAPGADPPAGQAGPRVTTEVVPDVPVLMPRLGEEVTEGTVTRWLKRVGAFVAADEPLLEISTDKVDTEIPSPVAGVMRRILVAEGGTAEVGAVLALISAEPRRVSQVPEDHGRSDGTAAVRMPAFGANVTEGTVTRWLKRVGAFVAADEPLLEISTDKVDTEIPSPVAGVMRRILVAEGETVEVGAVLALIERPADDPPVPRALRHYG